MKCTFLISFIQRWERKSQLNLSFYRTINFNHQVCFSDLKLSDIYKNAVSAPRSPCRLPLSGSLFQSCNIKLNIKFEEKNPTHKIVVYYKVIWQDKNNYSKNVQHQNNGNSVSWIIWKTGPLPCCLPKKSVKLTHHVTFQYWVLSS